MRKVFSRAAGGLRLVRHMTRMERQTSRWNVRPVRLAQGFLSNKEELYPFDRFDARWFLTDWEIEGRLRHVSDDAAVALLDDKLVFHHLLGGQTPAIPRPVLVGLTGAGLFVPVNGISRDEAFATPGRLIAKPVRGWGGSGVRIVMSPDDLPTGDLHLLERRVEQHAYAATIFPASLNTIRVVTMVDAAGAFLVGAVHRFGTQATAPVDNFKRGGVAAAVDPVSGRLSCARSNPGVFERSVHRTHPDTGAAIEGAVVPMWDDVVALALRLAELVPGLRHAGWDICVTPTGPCVIEGNGRLPNPNLLQSHRPILLDGRVRRFLHGVGVLSARRLRELDALQGP